MSDHPRWLVGDPAEKEAYQRRVKRIDADNLPREGDTAVGFRNGKVAYQHLVTHLDELQRNPALYWNMQLGWFTTIFKPKD
jgi:hypothetical protein